MRLLHIDLGDLGVMAHHVQATMTKHLLQGKDIAARAQIRDRKGVPEFVRVGVFHAGALSNAFDQEAQGIRFELAIAGDRE